MGGDECRNDEGELNNINEKISKLENSAKQMATFSIWILIIIIFLFIYYIVNSDFTKYYSSTFLLFPFMCSLLLLIYGFYQFTRVMMIICIDEKLNESAENIKCCLIDSIAIYKSARRSLICGFLISVLVICFAIFTPFMFVESNENVKTSDVKIAFDLVEMLSNDLSIRDEPAKILNISQMNANISTPSIIINTRYSGEKMIESVQANATSTICDTFLGIPYRFAVAVSIALIFIFIVIMWGVGYILYNRSDPKDKWWNHPLGLPNGSVRALIALLFVIIILLYGEEPQQWLMGIVGTIIGFYFGDRMSKPD